MVQPEPKNHPSGDNRFKLLDRAITKHHASGDALIEILHVAQGIFGFLENDLMVYIANALKLPLSRVYGVATFYHFFRLKPQGEHTFVLYGYRLLRERCERNPKKRRASLRLQIR